VIVAIEQLIKMKIKIISIQNNADAVQNLEHSIQTGDIAAAMNPFMVGEKCLSTIHVQNGRRENGNSL
jgi:3-methyladenine DNA glycosylase Tag